MSLTIVEILARVSNYGEGNGSALGFNACRQRTMPHPLKISNERVMLYILYREILTKESKIFMNIRTKSTRALAEFLSRGKNTKAKTSLTGMSSVSWGLPAKYLFL